LSRGKELCCACEIPLSPVVLVVLFVNRGNEQTGQIFLVSRTCLCEHELQLTLRLQQIVELKKSAPQPHARLVTRRLAGQRAPIQSGHGLKRGAARPGEPLRGGTHYGQFVHRPFRDCSRLCAFARGDLLGDPACQQQHRILRRTLQFLVQESARIAERQFEMKETGDKERPLNAKSALDRRGPQNVKSRPGQLMADDTSGPLQVQAHQVAVVAAVVRERSVTAAGVRGIWTTPRSMSGRGHFVRTRTAAAGSAA
jgi:hypothetical protein